MSKSLRFVGLDVHKDSIVIAVAEEGREAALFMLISSTTGQHCEGS